MAGLTPQQQRALRRRHKHERQAVVFGSLIAFLALGGLGATAIYTGAMDAPFLDREFTTPPPSEAAAGPRAPCPPTDTLPVDAAATQVRVLNGTSRAGLAATTATELTARGFVVAETGNYTIRIDPAARILFGEAGLAAAYSLAAHVPDADLILDTRADATIDLVLGGDWEGLADATTVVLDPTVPLQGTAECIPLEEALLVAAPGPTATPDAPIEEAPADAPIEEAPAEGDPATEG